MVKLKLLAVDVGNSTISTALFESETNYKRLDFPAEQDSVEAINQLVKESSQVFISSVVPEVSKNISGNKIYHITHKDIPLNKKIKNIETLGVDRLINSYAAYNIYKTNLIVVGLGTATIIDAVTKDGDYLGGMIFPGIQTMLNALYQRTSKLPQLKYEPTMENIGKDTDEAMQLGVQSAIMGGIKECIDKISKINSNSKVVITGGWSKVVSHLIPAAWNVIHDLTLIGIFSCGSNLIISSNIEDACVPCDVHTSFVQLL